MNENKNKRIVELIKEKFTSSNSNSVDRITIRREEVQGLLDLDNPN